MIARLQVREVAGYDEDVVFLVVPDGSNFGKRVLIVIGTCTLACVINVIKESEMDRISTPWVTVRLAQLLSRHVVTEEMPSEGDGGADAPKKKGVDTVVEMGSSTHVGSFQTEILEGKISQAPACNTHVMVTPIGWAEVKQDGGCQLPPGLQVLHTYTTMTAGRKQISIVVRNVTDQAIFLKRGTRVVHIVSATLAPPEETPSTQGEDAHAPKECMMVQEGQDKLLEKLNLDGLSQWTPRNAAIARELLLSYCNDREQSRIKEWTSIHVFCRTAEFAFIKPSTDPGKSIRIYQNITETPFYLLILLFIDITGRFMSITNFTRLEYIAQFRTISLSNRINRFKLILLKHP